MMVAVAGSDGIRKETQESPPTSVVMQIMAQHGHSLEKGKSLGSGSATTRPMEWNEMANLPAKEES